MLVRRLVAPLSKVGSEIGTVIAHVAFAILAPATASTTPAAPATAPISLMTLAVMALGVIVRTLHVTVAQRLLAVVAARESGGWLSLVGGLAGWRLGAVGAGGIGRPAFGF